MVYLPTFTIKINYRCKKNVGKYTVRPMDAHGIYEFANQSGLQNRQASLKDYLQTPKKLMHCLGGAIKQ